MHLVDGGRIIELRIFEADPPKIFREQGVKPGVFPEQVVVKQRNKDGSDTSVVYIKKETDNVG